MSDYTTQHFIAHRGLQHRYPENSLLGIQAAIDAGARHVEVDVQLSRDGQPLLYHDHELLRLSGLPGSVMDHDLRQLQQMPANEPQRLSGQFADVTIEPLSALLPLMLAADDVTFYIELKRKAIAHHGLLHCLRSLNNVLQPVLTKCVLISFDEQAVTLAKQAYGFEASGIVLSDWANRDAVIEATAADIAYINVNKIPPQVAIIAACPLAVYEISDAALAKTLLQRGADKIESFAIDTLLQSLCPLRM